MDKLRKTSGREEIDPKKLKEELDILDGNGPGGKMNYAYADNYYQAALQQKYGKNIEELRKEIKNA